MTKLRIGRRVGVHLYEQTGEHPSNWDPPVGTVFTPELATEIVTAVNHAVDLHKLERTIREAARHEEDDARALGMMDAADLIKQARERR